MDFFFNWLLVIGHKLIMTSFFPWKIILAITDEIEHIVKSFQVVTYSTICSGHIQHTNYDVTIVEVTMTRQKFQKLLNLEIDETLLFCDFLGNFIPITRTAKLFTVPYSNPFTNRTLFSSDEIFTL